MPLTKVVLYREDDGSVPLLDWLDGLQPKVIAKCRVRIERLRELGHELRRPEAYYLRDGIYELRVANGSSTTGCSTSSTGTWRPFFRTV